MDTKKLENKYCCFLTLSKHSEENNTFKFHIKTIFIKCKKFMKRISECVFHLRFFKHWNNTNNQRNI